MRACARVQQVLNDTAYAASLTAAAAEPLVDAVLEALRAETSDVPVAERGLYSIVALGLASPALGQCLTKKECGMAAAAVAARFPSDDVVTKTAAAIASGDYASALGDGAGSGGGAEEEGAAGSGGERAHWEDDADGEDDGEAPAAAAAAAAADDAETEEGVRERRAGRGDDDDEEDDVDS